MQEILIQALGGVIGQQSQNDLGPAAIKGFRKVKRLGAGGMGEVWLVQEHALFVAGGAKKGMKVGIINGRAVKGIMRLFH